MPRVNLDEPKWDQSTYWGRVKHFFVTTNPWNLLASNEELEKAKDIVNRHRNGESTGLSNDELWRAKHLYDSAFHPDSGEKMILIGRMSAQVPANLFISGAMVNFYRTKVALVFWQWVNQSFNAIVNYTNRSGDLPVSTKQLGLSYVLGTGGALVVSTLLQIVTTGGKYPLISRFVPFMAVATASCINIPTMRLQELRRGIPVLDGKGDRVGLSVIAAEHAISQTCLSRVITAMPVLVFPPIIMNYLERRHRTLLRKHTRLRLYRMPFQLLIVGVLLVFATPMSIAIYPQKMAIPVSNLEKHIRKKVNMMPNAPVTLYYNKGL